MLKAFFLFIAFVIFNSQSIAKDQCVENIINVDENNNIKQSQSDKLVTQANFFFDTSQNMVGFINSASSSYKLFISELIKKSPILSVLKNK